MPSVTIISTGFANTASVATAFRRLDYEVSLTTDPKAIALASLVVLPGVGSFAAGMRSLSESGLDDAIRARVETQRPLLAICLGLQLLCKSSQEAPCVNGLGVINTHVQRFPATVAAPQFGWNRVEADSASSFIKNGYAYYANSYCIPTWPCDWAASITTYDITFAGALEKGPVLACQFHPELSGAWGAQLLQRWLASTRAGVSC